MKQKLKELLRRHENLADEKAKMQADLQRAFETEKQILADGKITDAEISALTTARTTQELIARRLPIVDEALVAVGKELQDAMRDARAKYNRLVRKAVDAKIEAIIQANREFWPDNLRGLRKWVEGAAIPVVLAAKKFFHGGGFMPDAKADFFAQQARSFLDLAARAERQLGVTLD